MHSPEGWHYWSRRATGAVLAFFITTSTVEVAPVIHSHPLHQAEAVDTLDPLLQATETAYGILDRYDQTISLEDQWHAHAAEVSPENRLTPEGLASERFNLTLMRLLKNTVPISIIPTLESSIMPPTTRKPWPPPINRLRAMVFAMNCRTH